MREIKFRAYNKATKKWEYFDLFSDKSGSISRLQDEFGCGGYFDRSSVGQYTGLKDKGGNEIYEGDIVKLHVPMALKKSRNKTMCDIAAVVVWHDALGFWDCRWRAPGGTGMSYGLPKAMRKARLSEGTVEVIGNIYENPDLLKPGTVPDMRGK